MRTKGGWGVVSLAVLAACGEPTTEVDGTRAGGPDDGPAEWTRAVCGACAGPRTAGPARGTDVHGVREELRHADAGGLWCAPPRRGPAVIDDVAPSRVRPGGVVSIHGAGFGEVRGDVALWIAGARAEVLLWNRSHVVARVPPVEDGVAEVEVEVGGGRSEARALVVDAIGDSPPAPLLVSLSFDDTHASQWSARETLRSHATPATFFVNASRVDKPGFLTLEQLTDLARDGHEIGGHTLHHLHLPPLERDEQVRQVCEDRARLLARGFDARTFAYPGGQSNATAREVVDACGYDAARLVGGGVEDVVPPDPLGIRVHTTMRAGLTLEDLKARVLSAEAKGGTLSFVFHEVCTGCASSAIDPALLEAFVAWLASRRARGTVLRTVGELVEGRAARAVPVAPPPPPRPTLVRNGSFEDDAGGDGLPECWVPGDPGRPVAWSRATGGFDGTWHMHLDGARTGSTADRRLRATQDMGGCASPIEPGRTYRITARYQAGARVGLTAALRDEDGFWRPWLSSPSFAAAATWTEASFTLPATPADADALAVGFVVLDAADADVDAMRLEEVPR